MSISGVFCRHLCNKKARTRTPMCSLTFEEQGILDDALRGFDQEVVEGIDVVDLNTLLQQRLEGWQLS